MVEHQRLPISELHFDKFPIPSTSVLEDEIQNRSMSLFWFNLGSKIVNQRSAVDALNKIIQNF